MTKSYSQTVVSKKCTEEIYNLLTTNTPTITNLFTELFTITRLHDATSHLPGMTAAVVAGWLAGLDGQPSADLATALHCPTWPMDELHARLSYRGHAIGTEQLNQVLRRGQHKTQDLHRRVT